MKFSKTSQLTNCNKFDCGILTTLSKNNIKRNIIIAVDIIKLGYNLNKIFLVDDMFYYITDQNNNDKLEDDLIKLGKKYDQESVFISKKDVLYVNGRPFIFESCETSDIIFGSGSNAIMADKWSKEFNEIS